MKSGDTLVLKNMLPGENRWVGLTLKPPEGKEGETLSVNFYEMVGNTAVNGFSIAVRPSPMSRVIHDTLELHRSVFSLPLWLRCSLKRGRRVALAFALLRSFCHMPASAAAENAVDRG